ncbi:MAG: hypothetical protein M1830_003192 [Pleopsidium flavum]|nr:MAG: hypothetical protein M1830_003192 [Pleopsidium flavum]
MSNSSHRRSTSRSGSASSFSSPPATPVAEHSLLRHSGEEYLALEESLLPVPRYRDRRPSSYLPDSVRRSLSSSVPSQPPRSSVSSSVNLIPLVDFRVLDYVSSCDDNLMCAICHSPFVNPVRLRCDHVFCQECLNTALRHQPKEARNCPSCRSVVENDPSIPMPRMVLRMLDELKVKCPNKTLGCRDIVTRGFVQHHVEKYCEFVEVNCSLDSCQLKIWRKDADKPCLHNKVTCHDCSEVMMEKDLESHELGQCRRRKTVCSDCKSVVLRHKLDAHIQECPEVLLPCSAAPYGCTYFSKRTELGQHLTSCPLAKLGPFLSAQNDRLEAHDAALKYLQHKNEILESAMSSIQTTLDGSTAIESTLLDASLTASPVPLMNLSPTTAASAGPANPPFDSATHHLLSLHETLREEVDRVSSALSELDARSSMMLMNESLRAKEDMAHTNAAVNAIRMQLHWLMSARLQTQSRTNNSHVAGPSGGPRGGPGGAGGGPWLPIRRLSDTTRQETKL